MPKGAPGNGPRGANEPRTGHGSGAARAAGRAEGAADAGDGQHEDGRVPPADTAGAIEEAAWIKVGKRQSRERGGGENSRPVHAGPAATPAAPDQGALPYKPN